MFVKRLNLLWKIVFRKFIWVLLPVVIFVSFKVSALTPKKCQGTEREKEKALISLAISAKKYESKYGQLPEIWGVGLIEILEQTPSMDKIGGNIDVGADQNSMVLTCANRNFEPTLLIFYKINLNSHLITKDELKINIKQDS